MRTISYWLKTFFSPQTRLGRKGFALILVCAIISIFIFDLIARQLWLIYYEPFMCWKVNWWIFELFLGAEISIITGFWPLSIYLMLGYTEITFKEGINGFFLEMIMIDFLFIVYQIQCIRRCNDIDRKWYYCLIPFYNPFVLLFRKSKHS